MKNYRAMSRNISNYLRKELGLTPIQITTTRIRGWNNYSRGDYTIKTEKFHITGKKYEKRIIVSLNDNHPKANEVKKYLQDNYTLVNPDFFKYTFQVI